MDFLTPNIQDISGFPRMCRLCFSRLLEMANNLWWVWHPDAAELFRRLDRKLWEEVNHNPVKLLGIIDQKSWPMAAGNDGYLAQLNRVYEAFKDHLKETGWFAKTHADLTDRKAVYGGVFLGGVRLARIAADLFRRPGRAGRGSSEKRQRIGLPLVGRGAAVSQRIFPAVSVGRRLAAGSVSGAGFLQPAGRAAEIYRWLAGADPGRSAGQRGVLQGVAGQRGADSAVSAGHEPSGEFAGRPGDHQQALRRRHRKCASSRRSSWASAACGRWRR